MLNQNVYNTRGATYCILDIPRVRTVYFAECSLKFKASQTWNDLQINFNSGILVTAYNKQRDYKRKYSTDKLYFIQGIYNLIAITKY